MTSFHAWMIKALKLIGAVLKVIALFKSTMIDCKRELVLEDTNFGEVNINRY